MNRSEITLKGQKIPLKSSNSSEEDVIRLAQTLITNAEKRMKHAAPHQIAIIALLELADEYLKAKHGTQAWKQKIHRATEKLAAATGGRN